MAAPSLHTRTRTRMPAEERRAQIIAAAALLISERGYWGLSVQDVATSCDITLSGLLHHFPSKETLLIAVLEDRDIRDESAIRNRLQLGESELERRDGSRISIAETCVAIMDQNSDQREVIRLYTVLQAEALTPGHPATEYFALRQVSAIDRFAKLVPLEPNPRGIASQVLALIDGISLQWLRDPSSDLSTVWREATRDIPHLRPAS